jgi:hypothetical protein
MSATPAPPIQALPQLQPLPLRVLLDDAVKQTRRHLRAVYLPVALPVAFVVALIPLAQQLWLNPFMGGTLPDSPASFVRGLLATAAVALAFVTLNALAKSALLAAATDVLAGREVKMARAWATVFRPRVFFTLLLSWLAVAGGLLLCILPGLYLAALFSVVVPVVVVEGRTGLSALGRSAELLSHNPQGDVGSDPRLKAFLVMLVGGLINYAVGFVVQLPQVMMFRAIASGEQLDPAALLGRLTWIQVPSAALNVLVQMVVHAYVAFGLAMLFFDVWQRREGADLEAAVTRLAERAPGASGA